MAVVRVYETDYPFLREKSDNSGLALDHYAVNSYLFGTPNRYVGFRVITDGTSNTIIVGEVSAGLKYWGHPGNVRDPSLGLAAEPDRFELFNDGAMFVFCDGAVHFIHKDVDSDVLRKMADYHDGQPIGEF